ncbi:MAG: GTPase ObgE, partial [Gammaproteobacteria bacterium]|nr:GTPase ObgE [Gammaproteobacteria bacterium]
HSFSPTLAARPRWLVLNKIDLLEPTSQAQLVEEYRQQFPQFGGVYAISAVSGAGLQDLVYAIMESLEQQWRDENEDPELREQEQLRQATMQAEGRTRIAELRQQHAAQRRAARERSDQDDDDIEVEYVDE